MHSLENYTRIQTKNRQSLYPFSDQNGAKTILCKANLREYPPGNQYWPHCQLATLLASSYSALHLDACGTRKVFYRRITVFW